MDRMPPLDHVNVLRHEKPLLVSVSSEVVFGVFGGHWFDDLSHFVIATVLFISKKGTHLFILNSPVGELRINKCVPFFEIHERGIAGFLGVRGCTRARPASIRARADHTQVE